MKVKIKHLKFQRNGVMGECFYHCLADITIDKKRTMLVTFQAGEHDNAINRHTCRAVDINDYSEAWRGDEIAYDLQEYFRKEMTSKGGTIYDCCTKQDLYTV
jgi:hypothetical protein